MGGETALRRQLLAKQRRELAVCLLRHSGGIGEHLDPLLTIDLVAVEGHCAGGEEIVLRNQQLPAAAQRRRAGITGQSAAASGQAVLQAFQRQGRRQRQGQGQRHRQVGRPDP